jgi:hypothetical protein
MVGNGHVSEELRAYVKDRVDQAKKEEGLKTNPLNLKSCSPTQRSDNNKQTTIFQFIDTQDKRPDLVKYIKLEPNMAKLNTLFGNCNTVVKMINKRKLENTALANHKKRPVVYPSNDEIIAKIKAGRRRTI